jgi:hypothetical protein
MLALLGLATGEKRAGRHLGTTGVGSLKDPSEWERDLPPEVDVDLLTEHRALSEPGVVQLTLSDKRLVTVTCD